MATINVPFVATMNADGTATLQTVQQEEYNFTDAADATLVGDLSSGIINAFQLSQETQTSGTVVLNVAMRNPTAFRNAMTAALQAVTVSVADTDLSGQYATAGAVGKLLKEYIIAWDRQEIDTNLTSNTIGAAIEASEVQNLDITDFAMDASAASVDMYDGLDALNADVRRLIATQLPSSRYNTDASGTALSEAFGDSLPLISGDKMVFRFYVNSNISITEDPQDLGGASDGGAYGTATAGAGPGVGTYYGVSVRTIELVLTLA